MKLRIVEFSHRREQIAPTFVQDDQGFDVKPFCFRRVARLEAGFLLALADGRAQIVRHAPAQPIEFRSADVSRDAPSQGPCVPPVCTNRAA